MSCICIFLEVCGMLLLVYFIPNYLLTLANRLKIILFINLLMISTTRSQGDNFLESLMSASSCRRRATLSTHSLPAALSCMFELQQFDSDSYSQTQYCASHGLYRCSVCTCATVLDWNIFYWGVGVNGTWSVWWQSSSFG